MLNNFQSVFFSCSLLFVAVITTMIIPSTNAQEELQCRGSDLNMTLAQKTVIMDCLLEAGIDSILKIPMEKLACLGVCILEKKKLLTADGKLDREKIIDYVFHVMLPEEVRKPLVDGTTKCMNEHGDKIKMDGDPTCQTFMEGGQCVHDLFFEICVVE